MTNPIPHERDRAIMEGERNASLDAYSRVMLLTSAESRLYEAAFTNGWDRCAAHVQKPAEIEHVAGDVSKNWAESNMSTQPATQQEAQEPVAWYVTGCDRLLEAASDVQLLRMGYAAARLEIESLQARIKTMRASADSVLEDAARLDFLIEQRAYVVSDPDACPGYWLHFVHKETGKCWAQADEHPTPRAAIDAARKQGANHD